MKYKTIVIDPPWTFAEHGMEIPMQGGKFKRTPPYETMSDAEILNFPIKEFADDNCDLFLWCTHTKLPFAFKILEQWGFKFHALLTWDKQNGVCINGFYRRTEFVLYGYRGRLGINIGVGSYIPTLFREKSTNHSRKPDVFYELLRKRTQEPRIDIFARQRHFGFDAWGDEVDNQQTSLLSCG